MEIRTSLSRIPLLPSTTGLLRCSVLAFLVLSGCTASPQREILVIESTTLIDGSTGEAQRGMTIVIQGERVSAVGPHGTISVPDGARVLDGRSRWVIPGLVEVHTHSSGRRVLRQALALGVTTAHVMPVLPDTTADLEAWSRPPTAASPRLQVTNPLFTGGFPDNIIPERWPVSKPTTPDEARSMVRLYHSRGFRQIKIIQDDGVLFYGPEHAAPRLPEDVFTALVDQAHSLGMRVYVHAVQLRDSRQSISGGIDAFMHGAIDSLLDPSLWQQIREQRITWVPTTAVVLAVGAPRRLAQLILADPVLVEFLTPGAFQAIETTAEEGEPAWFMEVAAANLSHHLDILNANTRQARDNGVSIAVGSDQPPGVYTHIEMELLQEAGLTPAEVIVAATHGGAVALGIAEDIGTVTAGKLADLVILFADPLADIRNTRQVEFTVKGGTVYSREDLLVLEGG